jgi:hypothetical protein
MTLNPSNPPAQGNHHANDQLWFEQPRRRDPRGRYVGNDRDGYEVGGGLRTAWAAYCAEPWYWRAIYICGIAGAAEAVLAVLDGAGWL